MKLVLSTVAVLVVANMTVNRYDQKDKVWEFVWHYFRSFMGKSQTHPDAGLNITEFLNKYNYPVELHDVITEDGYILTLHRIPHGRNEESEKGILENVTRPPILLVHCLACSAMDWVWQGPNVSLPLTLADMGFDVWLANNRGSASSLRHQTLTPADAAFWDFSFHEKGYYDAASFIDHILNATNRDRITYVGHSQGTSAALVLTSSRPEYNDKLNLMVLMSPVAYLEHLTSPVVKLMVDYQVPIKVALDLFNIHGVPFSPLLSLVEQTFCSNSSAVQSICSLFLGAFSGFDLDQIDLTKLSVFLTNTPSGFSVKEVEHYIQEIKSGAFRQYDFGNELANFLHYGTSEPPSYDIGKVTAPLAVYYGKNDFLANVTDVEKFISELSCDTVDRYLIEYEYFNHLDFTMAKDVKTMLYDRVINVIRQFNPH